MMHWGKIASFLVFLISYSCNLEKYHKCFDISHTCYDFVSFDDFSTDSTSMECYLRLQNDSLFLLRENLISSGVLLEYLFFDFSLEEGDTIEINKPICYGKLCSEYSDILYGDGFIIVVLKKKENTFYFKHIMLNKFVDKYSFLPPELIYSINNSSDLTERYYIVEKKETYYEFKSFREVKGRLKEKYFY